MDDDPADAESCEFCGFALWTMLSGDVPPMDDAADGKAGAPTLRQYRTNFVRFGHVWQPDEPMRAGDWRATEAEPAYRELVRQAMAEWDAWLEHPDPDNTPEEVWRRWKRWEAAQRRKEGKNDE